MGSGSDLEHYGSVSSETDYETSTNVFFVNVNLTATDKLSFYLEGVYALSTGSFSSIGDMTPEGIDEHVAISPDRDDSTADYDFSAVNEYSDLDYTQLEGTLGLNYKLDKKASLYGSVNLMDLQDDQVYVYGDLSGVLVTYAAGMTVGF